MYKTDKTIEKEFEDISKKSIWELVPNTPRKIMIEDKEIQRIFTQQKEFILSQRNQDREAIREWGNGNQLVDPSQAGQFALHADGYNNALEDLLSFLDGLEE